MTLEVLFAQAGQGRTFLLMTLCGAVLALGVQLSGLVFSRHRRAGMAADLLCVLGLTAALGQILLHSGGGLRLYGLLGLCIGAVLYQAGIAPGVRWLAARLRRRTPAP